MDDVATVTDTENPAQVEVVEAEATPAAEPVAEAEKTDVEKSKEGTPKGVQKRIDELTAKAKLAEEERERTRIEAEFWKNQASKTQEEVEKPVMDAPLSAPKPVLENFPDYDAYVEALTDWKIEQKEQVSRQANAQYQQGQVVKFFESKVVQAAENLPDFEEVARDPAMRRVFSAMPHITDAIMESDRGPEIAYYLGKNRQKAIELAQMHPLRAAVELGKIEAKLLTPETRKISQAPEPITPIGAGANITEKAPEEMNPQEFAKWRRTFKSQRR